jgi:hypothetical protein
MKTTELKFSYNPFTKEFIKSAYNCHSADLQGKNFNEFIRGAIIKNKVYLRAYYPYCQDDIKDINLKELYEKSRKILLQFKKELLKTLEKNMNININEITYNADKDLLGLGIS